MAAGPLASLRRRCELLGARRDRQGPRGDPGNGSARGGRGEARCRGRCPGGSRLDRRTASRARRARRRLGGLLRVSETRPSRHGFNSSRGWPSSGRSSSCSRTCTGPTTGCSNSSTTSSTGRAACRSSWSPLHGRSCSAAAGLGRRQAERNDAVACSARRRGNRRARRGARRQARHACRGKGSNSSACRWKPALRGGVRPNARRAGRRPSRYRRRSWASSPRDSTGSRLRRRRRSSTPRW